MCALIELMNYYLHHETNSATKVVKLVTYFMVLELLILLTVFFFSRLLSEKRNIKFSKL
jgi:hypothetical protein